MSDSHPIDAERRPRLLEQLRGAIRCKHYSYRTEQAYVHWVRRFILFCGKRHPAEMGETEVTRFLNHLAVDRQVAAATQDQALSALLFLYREVLKSDLPWLDGLTRPRKPVRLPVVLTEQEVKALLAELSGIPWLVAGLLYGAGLRVLEALRLRVKDVDFDYGQVLVRDGKGAKDRVTMLPDGLVEPLRNHLPRVRRLHERDLGEGYGEAALPHALARKYPNAGREWGWQYVFPSGSRSIDPSAASFAATISIRRRFNVRSGRRPGSPASTNLRAAIRCGIRSQRICCAAVTTSERCRSCSAIPT